jgi:hypothetical protein
MNQTQDGNLEEQHPLVVKNLWQLSLVSIGILFLCSCATPVAPVTFKDMVGAWKAEGEGAGGSDWIIKLRPSLEASSENAPDPHSNGKGRWAIWNNDIFENNSRLVINFKNGNKLPISITNRVPPYTLKLAIPNHTSITFRRYANFPTTQRDADYANTINLLWKNMPASMQESMLESKR